MADARVPRGQGRGQKLEAEAKILASRPGCSRGFNITSRVSILALQPLFIQRQQTFRFFLHCIYLIYVGNMLLSLIR